MIQQRAIGSLTELYVGGGNFITQAYPTNFHEFATRKILTSGDCIDNYREVTAAERATIEAADAKWEKPGDWLIEQAEANGVVYNTATGYFELNGLTDITAEQMVAIISIASEAISAQRFCYGRFRTNTRFHILGGGIQSPNADYAFYNCSSLETIDLTSGSGYAVFGSGVDLFAKCSKLRKIIGKVMFNNANSINAFSGCPSLEEFTLRLRYSINLSSCPKVSLKSLENTIKGSEGVNTITITLHPEAYARVTDDIFTAAAAKNITIATTG